MAGRKLTGHGGTTPGRKRVRAAIYCRVSTEEQAESGLGLDAQLTSCQAMATVKDWPSPRVYRDEGVSGTKGPEQRPGLAALLADARAGKLDAVIIKSLDRLGRKTRLVLELVDDLATAGVSLISCQEALDTTTPQGQFVLTIFAAIGQLERDQIALRTRAALAELRRRAGQAGGKLPYGYLRTEKGTEGGVAVDDLAAHQVRTIFALRRAGLPLRVIAAQLLPPSPRGGDTWHHTAVAAILANEATYRGQAEEAARAAWPVILGEETEEGAA